MRSAAVYYCGFVSFLNRDPLQTDLDPAPRAPTPSLEEDGEGEHPEEEDEPHQDALLPGHALPDQYQSVYQIKSRLAKKNLSSTHFVQILFTLGLKKEYFVKVSRTDFIVQKEKNNQNKNFKLRLLKKLL